MHKIKMKLFVIYIGGSHERSLIELHDMRFVVANTIEDTYDTLRDSWWGKPESLHLDAWGTLEYADGHAIHLKNEPPSSLTNKLYFVNLGGYDHKQFTELHKNIFVVAENEQKAKIKALKQILSWESFHRDYQYAIENALDLSTTACLHNQHIHLVPTDTPKEFQFVCQYTKIP